MLNAFNIIVFRGTEYDISSSLGISMNQANEIYFQRVGFHRYNNLQLKDNYNYTVILKKKASLIHPIPTCDV